MDIGHVVAGYECQRWTGGSGRGDERLEGGIGVDHDLARRGLEEGRGLLTDDIEGDHPGEDTVLRHGGGEGLGAAQTVLEAEDRDLGREAGGQLGADRCRVLGLDGDEHDVRICGGGQFGDELEPIRWDRGPRPIGSPDRQAVTAHGIRDGGPADQGDVYGGVGGETASQVTADTAGADDHDSHGGHCRGGDRSARSDYR